MGLERDERPGRGGAAAHVAVQCAVLAGGAPCLPARPTPSQVCAAWCAQHSDNSAVRACSSWRMLECPQVTRLWCMTPRACSGRAHCVRCAHHSCEALLTCHGVVWAFAVRRVAGGCSERSTFLTSGSLTVGYQRGQHCPDCAPLDLTRGRLASLARGLRHVWTHLWSSTRMRCGRARVYACGRGGGAATGSVYHTLAIEAAGAHPAAFGDCMLALTAPCVRRRC